MALQIFLEITGTLIVLFGLREVFRDIFHPTRSGTLSDFVGRASSFLMRDTRLRPAAGPIALVATILAWVLTLNLGFALIYCALGSGRILVAPGTEHPGAAHAFMRGLYVSLGSFDTFQTFDAVAKTGWLRLIITIEGLVGISMITASISWLVLLYPALSRMRQFAKRSSILIEAERRSGVSVIETTGVDALTALMNGIVQFRIDVILFPILLNFYAADNDATISFVLPDIHSLAQRAVQQEGQNRSVLLAGIQLQIALEQLAGVLAQRVVETDDKDITKVFEAFKQRDRQ